MNANQRETIRRGETVESLLSLVKQFDRDPVVGLMMHPSVLELLKRQTDVLRRPLTPPPFSCVDRLCGLAIYTDERMDRDKPTGRYLVPRILSGLMNLRPTDRDRVRVESPFVTYGPEDIPWLLYADLIREERKPHFVELRRSEQISVHQRSSAV